MRELITEIARLTNEMAGLRATPAVPQGWTDADSDSARLALELECLLMDTKDLSVVSKWWASANEALELHRQRLAATPAPAPAAGILDRARWGGQVVNLMRLAEAADKAVASMTVPAPEAGSESKIVIDVGPGGSGGGPAEAAPPATEQTAPAPAQDEPFGYFRVEPFGWTDCAKDDEGAIALYERPQEWELRKELDSANDFIKSLADLIQKYETMLGYRTTNAPEGAYALAEAKGESSLNTELDLACADSTCQHDFALDPKSSIRICLKCGTPERLAKKTAAPVGLTDEGPSHVALLNEGIRSLDAEHEAREFFESENRDSYGFKRSVRGTYVNGAVARDWKWFQLGVHHATKDLP